MSQTRGRMKLRFEKSVGLYSRINEKGLEDIGKIQSILQSSKCPGMFFTELYLKSPGHNWWDGVLKQEMPLLNLLENFGSTLKCLKLKRVNMNLSIFRPLIETWCTNLEELSIFHIIVEEDDSMNLDDFETLPTPLKLNLRKFTFHDASHEEAERKANLIFIFSIIENSPKLQSLDVGITPGPDLADLWKKIQSVPHISENLEELKIELCDAEDISFISDISLSDKFRSLTLEIYHPSFPKEQLAILLKKMGESLEELCLLLHSDDVKEDEDEGSLWKEELPLMKKLKVLKYISGFEMWFVPMDFLEKLPSLEIFRFEAPDFCSGFLKVEYVDAWFRNISSLTRRPHTTLNTLSIGGSPGRPETVVAINRMFPNLRELSLVLDGVHTRVFNETIESWLMSVFQGFSEMKNLKILSINFYCWFEENVGNDGMNFQACFSPLETSQSLEKLKMFSDSRRACPIYFPPGLEKIFVKIPKLKVLTLEGFQMKLSDARNLFKTLDQKGITLNLL